MTRYHIKQFLFLWILLCAATVIIGCSDQAVTQPGPPPPPTGAKSSSTETYDYTHRLLTPPQFDPPLTVALIRFADERTMADVPFGSDPRRSETSQHTEVNVQVGGVQQNQTDKPPPNISMHGRAMLKNALVNSGSFRVVERERILDILNEQLFAKTPYVATGTGAEAGKIIGARYLIEGSVGRNEDRSLKGALDDPWAFQGSPPSLPERIFSNDPRVSRGRLLELHRRAMVELQAEQLRAANTVCAYLSLYDVVTAEAVVEAYGIGETPHDAIRDAVGDLIAKAARLR